MRTPIRADNTTLNNQLNLNIIVFLLVILLILGVMWVATVQNGERADAIQIHTILDDPCRGAHNTYQSRSWRTPNKFFQTCQLDDGRWGFRVIDKIKGIWHEKTSFVPGNGSYTHLVEPVNPVSYNMCIPLVPIWISKRHRNVNYQLFV